LFESTKYHAVELEKANKAKHDFLGVMSHELRTHPRLSWYLQDRMIGELNTEQAGAVGTIEKHSRELLAPVDSILHATLIEGDRFLIETHPKFGRADWRLENQVPSVTHGITCRTCPS